MCGLLTPDDRALAYVELDGLANLRASDNARAVTTSLTFRTGEPRDAWLNTFLRVVEGVLDSVRVGGSAPPRPARRADDLNHPLIRLAIATLSRQTS